MARTTFVALATTALVATSFAPPRAPAPRARARSAADEDADDLAFLGKKMKEKQAEASGFDVFGAMKRFGQGLDDFVDDAMMRKLGNGAEFYGKRKSNFYGKDDVMKATGAANEEYDGPVGGGYFRRDGEGRPVSRKGARLGKGE
mmetsp:Transcript_22105/g.68143  ORF Transcript_22105/g.68143 Transcript_22105/m.68143 type:complete len:145 (-) Transcript_22105:27-461(-)